MKLLTKEVIKAMPALYSTEKVPEKEKKIVVKFFCPWGRYTWYVLEGGQQEDGDWMFFGFVEGNHPDNDELGYFVLSELEKINGPFGLKIERDINFEGHTLADVRERKGRK